METEEEEYSLVEAVRSSAKSHLLNDLDKYDGIKLFVWESECMKRVDMLISNKEFEKQNVKHVYFPKKADQLVDYLNDQIKHIFFVIPPLRQHIKHVFEFLGSKLPGSFTFHIRLLTRISKQLQELFDSNEHVQRRKVTIQSWPLYWAPTFGDFVLNNFGSTSPARLMLTDDFEQFFLCACSLNDMFTARQFYWHGAWAQQVMHNWSALKQSSHDPTHVFDQIIVIDRLMDPITCLLEQFSFSGVLDTVFGINVKGVVEVPEEMLSRKLPLDKSREGPVKKIPLDTDAYKKLIHLSMNGATTQIRTTLRELSDTQSAHEKLTSIKELKQYMPILPKLMASKMATSQALSLVSIGYCFYAQTEQYGQIQCERAILNGHYSSSTVIEHIEDLVIEGGEVKNAISALRLIALQSLVCNGLHSKAWDEYQKLLVQSYGPSAVAWCLNLQITGLVYVSRSASNSQFSQIGNELKRLRCVVDEDPLAAYYNGYVPLMVRQIEQKMRENWKDFKSARNEKLKEQFVASSQTPKRALFVVGGLTRSEIACLRALKPAFQCIFTTSILKQGDLVDFTKFS